jgi:competence ComEA-like helix-hairpin-helix protein
MILRSLPPEVLAADLSEFEASGAAAHEVGLPMNLILGQLPSGKVEIPLADLVPHFPPGYLQPTQSIASYLPNLINLPLMDVVMRIPPDLLALRPDQKDVDSSVINMADPFTEEILREQAEAARRGAPETNIIDESQVTPAEEFVPRDRVAASGFIPPLRPTTRVPTVPPPPMPTPPAAMATPAPVSPAGRAEAHPVFSTPPRPRTSTMPPPPTPVAARAAGAVPPPPPPVVRNDGVQAIAPAPPNLRPAGAIPMRPQAAVTSPVALPQPVPPAAGASAPLPTPALARPTTSLPMPPRPAPVPQTPQPPLRPTTSLPTVPPGGVRPAPAPVPEPPAEPEPAPIEQKAPPAPEPEPAPAEPVVAAITPGQPDAAAAELQRLAALAMAQEEAPAAPEAPDASLSNRVTAVVPAPSDSFPAPVPAATSSQMLSSTSSRPFGSKSITAPMPPPAVEPAPVEETTPAPPPAPAAEGGASVALNLNSCTAEELLQIPGCDRALAGSIIAYRAKVGSFRKLEDLLEVPGMNGAAYRALTGEEPAQAVTPSVAELLGFPADQKLTLKDVTERIGHWPDVTGCILSQKTGLHLVGHVPAGYDRAAIVAFAPRIFEAVNKSFSEIASKETDELIIPTTGTSFHIFRKHDLYLIILSRLPQMPDRHAKIARLVLAGVGPGTS